MGRPGVRERLGRKGTRFARIAVPMDEQSVAERLAAFDRRQHVVHEFVTAGASTSMEDLTTTLRGSHGGGTGTGGGSSTRTIDVVVDAFEEIESTLTHISRKLCDGRCRGIREVPTEELSAFAVAGRYNLVAMRLERQRLTRGLLVELPSRYKSLLDDVKLFAVDLGGKIHKQFQTRAFQQSQFETSMLWRDLTETAPLVTVYPAPATD